MTSKGVERGWLADTHVLLWWLGNMADLGTQARAVIAEPANVFYVSVASIWEVAIKRALGKLEAPEGLTAVLEEEGFAALPIEAAHAEHAGGLPLLHRDPFDRMLVAQARLEDLTLVSADVHLRRYGVRVLDARR